eukprot:15434130-Alexandrium_andersonii.AAC.1
MSTCTRSAWPWRRSPPAAKAGGPTRRGPSAASREPCPRRKQTHHRSGSGPDQASARQGGGHEFPGVGRDAPRPEAGRWAQA